MSTKEMLLKKIENISEADPLLEEVLTFLQFLETKKKDHSIETYLLSLPALNKEWLMPEEEEAWKNL